MWRIWSAPNNASKWQMGFNSAFKGLIEPLLPVGVQGKLVAQFSKLFLSEKEQFS
jgi:hypothetical protein